MAYGDELNPSKLVFRLVPLKPKFYSSEVRMPLGGAFELSSEDRSSSPPGLSVWDAEKATLAQARAILSNDEQPGFKLSVEAIKQTSALFPPSDLRVVETPPQGGDACAPGADGHCDIRGLEPPPGTPNGRNIWKSIRDELALRCEPMDDP